MEKEKIKVHKSFGHAFNGIKALFEREWKFTLYSMVSIILIFLMIILKFTLIDAIIVIIMIGFVFACEALNTLVEIIFDELKPEYSSKIQKIKDASAAFVLISVITAIIVGVLIFWPYFNS